MNGPKLPHATPGSTYKASDQNKIVDEVERQGRIHVGGGLSGSSGPFGTLIQADAGPERIYAKITAVNGGGASDWTEQIPASGGTWTDGTRSGTSSSDPAYEANGQTIPGLPKVVIMERDPNTTEWIYQAGSC